MVSSWGDFAPSSVGDAMPSEKSLLKMIIKHKMIKPSFYRHVCLFLMLMETLRILLRRSQEGLGGECC